MNDALCAMADGLITKQQLKERYRANQKERFTQYRNGEIGEPEVLELVIIPPTVDMKSVIVQGHDHEITAAIELLYRYASWEFDPKAEYPPGALDNFRSEWSLNARGIYYHDEYIPRRVTMDRKVWVPALDDIDWDEPAEWQRRERARCFAEHNVDNETWTNGKSEYAWEADAWSDLFKEMRNDPVLAMDKRQYSKDLLVAHPVLYTLTGDTEVIQCIPDTTFGFSTFSEYETNTSICAEELRRSRLEELLLHPKCGLLVDAKWGETDLVFPFAVYEAKGWSGDCRKARHQACLAAATYLDLLETLVHTPGPVESPKPYQTPHSHRYQVFVLTSFGSHWHLLVGYRRPRAEDQHGGVGGMSETVYIFQKVWSGRVVNERTAWELCALLDQIHQWAVTEFRSFVLEHLKPWHKFCDDNFLLDWDGVYDRGPESKSARGCAEDEDLPLPSWTKRLNEASQGKIQIRAKQSLAKAIATHQLRKGKGKRPYNSDHDNHDNPERRWQCTRDECALTGPLFESGEALMIHCKRVHDMNTCDLFKLKRIVTMADNTSGHVIVWPTLDAIPEHMRKRARLQ